MPLEPTLSAKSLVLYKQRPARILQVGNKIDIETRDDRQISVRPKDVTLLHGGPLDSLEALQPLSGEIEVAWELLEGETTNLAELADLIYSEFTPESAWATWQLVEDGLFFKGEPGEIEVQTAESVAAERQSRREKAEAAAAWEGLLQRFRARLAGESIPLQEDDRQMLEEVEGLAYQQTRHSRLLAALGVAETAETAHQFLLDVGYWAPSNNPHPLREGVFLSQPAEQLPPLPLEERLDLTHLPAFAIDDAGSTDPDDAISLDGERLWIHVADVAALVAPDTPPDWEARARGSNVYLPEGTIRMLPREATETLGLGLQDPSPALSIGVTLTDAGEIGEVEITTSQIHVTRLTYEEAEAQLDAEPLRAVKALADRFMARRLANGATQFDLPEVKVRVENGGQVVITPIVPLLSRELVREAMLVAGEAVGHYAIERDIPLPFTGQPEPREGDDLDLEGLAGMMAMRRRFRPSHRTIGPEPHAGLGLPHYTRVTSPLRRYLDLVTHQQLRAFLSGGALLDDQEVMQRIGAAEAISRGLRWAARNSDKHWTLVYLLQNPEWEGEAVVYAVERGRCEILIPDLGLETVIYPQQTYTLNETIQVRCTGVNLPALEARFEVG